jgi:hypothetical protein
VESPKLPQFKACIGISGSPERYPKGLSRQTSKRNLPDYFGSDFNILVLSYIFLHFSSSIYHILTRRIGDILVANTLEITPLFHKLAKQIH